MATLPLESQKTAQIRFTLNGEEVDVLFAPYKTLLEVLREDLLHTGTKHGCELGECGACAVLLDGKPVLSCLVLALECAGRRVLTIEGLSADGRLHPLQDAFADLGAAQSGYCTPRSEEHTSELQSRLHLVCRLLLEKKKSYTRSAIVIVTPLRTAFDASTSAGTSPPRTP